MTQNEKETCLNKDWADKIGENYPEIADFSKLLSSMKNESDRGVVLIMAGFIERQLRDLLEGYLIDCNSRKQLLNGSLAPLAGFGPSIFACHALGLLNEQESHDLNLIRKIRNKFAHDFRTSFDEQSVNDLCRNFNIDVTPIEDEVSISSHDIENRTLYTAPAMHYILTFWHRQREVDTYRLSPVHWKRCS